MGAAPVLASCSALRARRRRYRQACSRTTLLLEREDDWETVVPLQLAAACSSEIRTGLDSEPR